MQLNKAFEKSINQSKQEQQKQEKDVGLIHWRSVRRSWGLWIQVRIWLLAGIGCRRKGTHRSCHDIELWMSRGKGQNRKKQKKTPGAGTTDLRKLMTINAIWQDMHMKAEFKRMGCILPRLLKDNCEAHEHHLHAHDTACTWWLYSSHSSCVLWSNQNSWYSGTHVHGHLFYHLEKRYINVLDTLIRYPYPSWLNFSWRYARTYVWNNELVPH